jgi:hypothetical protein
MVVHTFSPSAWEDLEFKATLGYIVPGKLATTIKTLSQKYKTAGHW